MVPRDRPLELIAHRGCASLYPENTLSAIRRSLPHVDGIEVDVRRCASGELVVFHDDRLDRVTDGTGSIADTEWHVLRRLTVDGSGAAIPQFSDVLEVVPESHRLVVELKVAEVAQEVITQLATVDHDVLVQSFLPPAIAAVTAQDPSMSTGLLMKANADIDVVTVAARNLGCEWVNPHYTTCLEDGVVDRLHAAGFNTFAWTIDDQTVARQLMQRDVDGLIVDRWDVLEPNG